MSGLGSMAGLEVEVDRGGVCAAVDNDEGPLFTVGRACQHRGLGAVAWIDAWADNRMAWIDRHGTEVRSRSGTPSPEVGRWCWLLDLAVEAGLVLDDIDPGPG